MDFYTKTTESTLAELAADEHGLTNAEAAERQKRYGRNVVKVKGEPLWRKLIEPFADVFMAVLAVAVVISVVEDAVFDAAVIGFVMLANAAIYYVQRFSTERVLRSLNKHNPLQTEVLRGGEHETLDASELVPGDVVLLHEGDKIPADCRLLAVNSVRVDESQLTGESLPVEKQTKPLPQDTQIYERSNMVYQGSFIVGGEATAVVVVTGNSTEFGRLAGLTSAGEAASPVQQRIDKLITQIVMVMAAVSVLAFGLAMMRGMEWSEAVRYIIALAVSAVPEGLPVAISVIVVLGMRRMAAKKALVRSMAAIETIGTLTTIATDKTGTLTQNKLTVQKTWPEPSSDSGFTDLLARVTNSRAGSSHDPLDTALYDYVKRTVGTTADEAELVTVLPFEQASAMSGNIWRAEDGKGGYLLAVKGAPEKILARCNPDKKLAADVEHALNDLTSQGYRVIACASARLDRLAETIAALPKETDFTFGGLVAVADVLRPEAAEAISTALRAGVTVRMITGDHFETAYQIGKQLGMVTDRKQVFDCRQIENIGDRELGKIVERTRVFSRVLPEHKFRILTILKKHNITAMTGDGVNDVPALAGAHVGVAMGSGSSIAKDACDIILTDDNFKSIVDAIREGRIIYDNIKRMVAYLLATNTGEVLTALAALIIGVPIPLAPVQILWVNLVTDTAMVIPLGLEPGEKRVMQDPPHSPKAPLLEHYLIGRVLVVAVVMAALTLGSFMYFRHGHGNDYARTIAFIVLVVTQWASAFSMRSDQESVLSRLRKVSWPFYTGLLLAVALQLLALYGPLARFMHVVPVDASHAAVAAAGSFVLMLTTVELHKVLVRPPRRHAAS